MWHPGSLFCMRTLALSSPETAVYVPLFRQTPSALLKLCVVIPVRNEADHLLQTLDALRNQQDGQGRPLSHSIYEVLLLVNNCTDDTYQIARNYQQDYPDFMLNVTEYWLAPKVAHVGTARRLLMDEAHYRFALLGNPKGIIASTDGDTEVDPTWVYHTIEEIQKGTDAVGGRILVKSSDDHTGSYHLLDETYRMLIARTESILDAREYDPWPNHFQYYGASLAVTASFYLQAGRLPVLPYLEDEAFCKALLYKDAKIRRSPLVKVMTSNRHDGRVHIGLSEQLKKWAQMEQAQELQMVAGAPEIIARLTHRCTVRTCWNDATTCGKYNTALLASVAHDVGISPHRMQEELEQSRYFGQLWESVEQHMKSGGWHNKWQPVAIDQAILALQKFIENHC